MGETPQLPLLFLILIQCNIRGRIFPFSYTTLQHCHGNLDGQPKELNHTTEKPEQQKAFNLLVKEVSCSKDCNSPLGFISSAGGFFWSTCLDDCGMSVNEPYPQISSLGSLSRHFTYMECWAHLSAMGAAWKLNLTLYHGGVAFFL